MSASEGQTQKIHKVGLLFGGRSAEHEVSLMSARSVFAEVEIPGIDWIPLAISQGGKWLSPEVSRKLISNEFDRIPEEEENKYGSILESIKENLSEEIELIFPLLHGPHGEDGTMQGFLQTAGIPFVGSKTAASAVAMDKSFAKNIFERHNIRQADYLLLTARDIDGKEKIAGLEERVIEKIGLPCFIKPVSLGSSIGISKVKDVKDLMPAVRMAFEYDNRILLEEFISGREIECSVLGTWKNSEVSRPGEIIPEHEFYDYEAKYFSNRTSLITPAELSRETEEEVRSLARRAFRLLYCDGLARVDFFLTDDGEVYLNEINTIPGFTEKSMYARMWQASGLGYAELVKRLLEIALD